MPSDISSTPVIGGADPAAFARVLEIARRNQNGVSDESVLALWESLATNLVAIIGHEGFNALFSRSLHLAGASHPWLGESLLTRGNLPRFVALKSLLQAGTPEQGTIAMVGLFTIFTDLLSGLIGQRLTTNILRAAWGDAYEEAAQEISLWPKK